MACPEGRGAAAAAEVHAEVPAAGARGAQASALKVFLERRRRQHAERGVTVALPALHAEWRRMLPAERDMMSSSARRAAAAPAAPRRAPWRRCWPARIGSRARR
ncbi:unnamed protein product [Prorocentrum cordatum]|uniref:Uncharacterized protein n=1 Tax=Prorocentrum cordatum TaxID=2364126 RepID=A0ABN9RHG0_9DINO|nr:unnamed protein product [Polarella glacialis]